MKIGLTNVLTADREVPPIQAIDAERRDAYVAIALRALGEGSAVHDAAFRGVRARLFTNDFHLGDFFRANFFTPQEWQDAAGEPPPPASIRIFAATSVRAPTGVFVHAESATAVVLNVTRYAALREAALHLVGLRATPAEGTAVARDGGAVLFTGPAGSGRATCAYGLMQFPTMRLAADGAVLLDGGRLYPVERRFYRRTGLLADLPELAYPLFTSPLENVEVSAGAVSDGLVDALIQTRHPVQAAFFKGMPREELRAGVAALVHSAHGRAMLDPADLFPPDRLAIDPARGLKLSCVFALRRDPGDRAVLRRTAAGYDLNLNFAGAGHDAVLAALKIINKTLETMPESVSLTVDDYMRYIE